MVSALWGGRREILGERAGCRLGRGGVTPRRTPVGRRGWFRTYGEGIGEFSGESAGGFPESPLDGFRPTG